MGRVCPWGDSRWHQYFKTNDNLDSSNSSKDGGNVHIFSEGELLSENEDFDPDFVKCIVPGSNMISSRKN